MKWYFIISTRLRIALKRKEMFKTSVMCHDAMWMAEWQLFTCRTTYNIYIFHRFMILETNELNHLHNAQYFCVHRRWVPVHVFRRCKMLEAIEKNNIYHRLKSMLNICRPSIISYLWLSLIRLFSTVMLQVFLTSQVHEQTCVWTAKVFEC